MFEEVYVMVKKVLWVVKKMLCGNEDEQYRLYRRRNAKIGVFGFEERRQEKEFFTGFYAVLCDGKEGK